MGSIASFTWEIVGGHPFPSKTSSEKCSHRASAAVGPKLLAMSPCLTGHCPCQYLFDLGDFDMPAYCGWNPTRPYWRAREVVPLAVGRGSGFDCHGSPQGPGGEDPAPIAVGPPLPRANYQNACHITPAQGLAMQSARNESASLLRRNLAGPSAVARARLRLVHG